MKPCQYSYRCKFHTQDCSDTAEFCRIHNRYEAEAKRKIEQEKENMRHIHLNDCGLVNRVK